MNIKNITMAICPTVRDTSGLALSSRNRRLTEAQREVARLIYQSLLKARQAWQSGKRSVNELESLMRGHMNHPILVIEYAVIRDGNDLSAVPPDNDVVHARALIAAYVGKYPPDRQSRTGTRPVIHLMRVASASGEKTTDSGRRLP